METTRLSLKEEVCVSSRCKDIEALKNTCDVMPQSHAPVQASAGFWLVLAHFGPKHL